VRDAEFIREKGLANFMQGNYQKLESQERKYLDPNAVEVITS